MLHDANIHRHLDWRSPLDWLGSPNYWLLADDDRIHAALACPEDPPGVAWLRFFGHGPHLSGPEAWSALWDTVRAEALRSEETQVAAIVTKYWFQNFLLSQGFKFKQKIVLLELKQGNIQHLPFVKNIKIRPMQDADMQSITEVDLSAFGRFWHNTYESLMRARRQSVHASVAEDASGRVVGYQLSTGNPLGAHLARLGVRKEAQGQGVGTALMRDLLQDLEANHRTHLSVNTQSDNLASLSLYKKIGFTLTGEYYPVMVYPGEVND
jgi:ribosomal-protein-alanine N-acetyltransferase